MVFILVFEERFLFIHRLWGQFRMRDHRFGFASATRMFGNLFIRNIAQRIFTSCRTFLMLTIQKPIFVFDIFLEGVIFIGTLPFVNN